VDKTMDKTIVFNAVSSGFFSCSSLILMKIIEYFNNNKCLPESLITKDFYTVYKRNDNDDIYNILFKKNNMNIEYTKPIKFNEKYEAQFSDYKLIYYNDIRPFIEKYFSVSEIVLEKISELEVNYNINYDNLCGIFYRGNDKIKETQKPSYSEVINKAVEFKEKNNNCKFIIQTDEREFLEEFIKIFPDSIYFKEIPIINNCMTTVAETYRNDPNKLNYILYYVSSIKIFSKLNNIITTSGNSELFVMFYRNNSNGVIQYLKKNEYIHGCKNNEYDANNTIYWF